MLWHCPLLPSGAYFSLHKSGDRLLFAGHFPLFGLKYAWFSPMRSQEEKNHIDDTLQPCCHHPVASRRHCVLSIHLCCGLSRGQAFWSIYKQYFLQCYYQEWCPGSSCVSDTQTVSAVRKTGRPYSPHPALSFGALTKTRINSYSTGT